MYKRQIILFATIPTQFYTSFFAKHLGDLGMGNGIASVITFFSVALELPFLAMGDRLFKKMSVWNWLLVGMALNGVRWLGSVSYTHLDGFLHTQLSGRRRQYSCRRLPLHFASV